MKKIIAVVLAILSLSLVSCDRTEKGKNKPCSVPIPADLESNRWLFELYDTFLEYKDEGSSTDVAPNIDSIKIYSAENDRLVVVYSMTGDINRLQPWQKAHINAEVDEKAHIGFALVLQKEQDSYSVIKEISSKSALEQTTQIYAYYSYLEEYYKNAATIYEISVSQKEFTDIVKETLGEILKQDEKDLPADAATSEYTITDIQLWGDENEFCAQYRFDGVCGSGNPILAVSENKGDGKFYNCYITVRLRKIADGKYALIGYGGGAAAYGLKKVKFTL